MQILVFNLRNQTASEELVCPEEWTYLFVMTLFLNPKLFLCALKKSLITCDLIPMLLKHALKETCARKSNTFSFFFARFMSDRVIKESFVYQQSAFLKGFCLSAGKIVQSFV